MRESKTASALLLLALGLGMSTWAAADTTGKKMVCWNDASGRRACGDAVPPEFAKKEKKIVDNQGRIIRTLPAELTPEQRAARDRESAAALALKQQNDAQAAADRALIDSYSRPEEIADVRNDRLSTLDTSARLTQRAIVRDTATLTGLKQGIPAGTKPDKRTADQIAKVQGSLDDNRRAYDALQRNRDAMCQSFDHDIRRFQELHTGQVTFESPCPRPDADGDGETGSNVDLAAVRSTFDGYAALMKAHQAEMFSLIADDAVIRFPFKAASGNQETAELSRDDYKAQTLDAWKKTKVGVDLSDITVEADKAGGAKVSGKVSTVPGKPPAAFYVVMRQAQPGQWRIVEQWSEAQF